MLRFRLGSIPVVVHPGHLLFALVLGLSAAGEGGGLASGAIVAIWVVLIFVSVLFHELGHALAFRAYGYSSSIQLIIFGGVTMPDTDRPLSWGKEVVTTLAGPTFGAALAVLCHSLAPRATGPLTAYALQLGSEINLVWAVFNLLPVLPMDGGRVSRAILGRVFGRSGVLAAHGLGVLVCGALAWLLYRTSAASSVTLVFLLLFAVQNFQALLAAWRAEREPPPSPEILEAERLFQAGDLASARVLAARLLAGATPAPVRDRLHHLLGWIALKEGEGARALRHFGEMQRGVEAEALAAGLTLVGDDARAAGVWQVAARERRDPNVLHEYAGTLIRLGRAEEAAALPGVDLATAYACAERVAFLRGAYSEAARFGEESLSLRPSASRAYDVACAHARAGDVRRAMALLVRARDLGYSDRAAAETDPDLVSLAGEPAFRDWLGSLEESAVS